MNTNVVVERSDTGVVTVSGRVTWRHTKATPPIVEELERALWSGEPVVFTADSRHEHWPIGRFRVTSLGRGYDSERGMMDASAELYQE